MYSDKGLADSLAKARSTADSLNTLSDYVICATRENPDNGKALCRSYVDWAKRRALPEGTLRAYLCMCRIYLFKGKIDSMQAYLLKVQTDVPAVTADVFSPAVDLEWYHYYAQNKEWRKGLGFLRRAYSNQGLMPESVYKNEICIRILSSLGIYYDAAQIEHIWNTPDSLEKYFNLTGKYLHNNPDSLNQLPNFYICKARYLLYHSRAEELRLFLFNCIARFRQTGHYTAIAQAYQDLAFSYSNKAGIVKAMAYIDSAVYYADKHCSKLRLSIYVWSAADIYANGGNFKHAYFLSDSLRRLNSITYNEQLAEKLADAEKKHESVALRAKNAEAEVEIARSERFIYSIIAGFMVILGAVGFAFYRYNVRQQALNAEARRKTELADQRRIITEQLNRQISAERTEVNALLEEMLVRDKQNIPLNGLRNAVQSYLTGNTSRDQRRQKFTELYPDFFVNLLTQHPGLTPSEQDIAMFVTEGTTNTDMTEIFSWVNTDSAANRKSKLKVKLGFSSLPDLERYLSALK
ncbi:MAG: hypothetical protein V4543_03210 [Bacteroidota bacterium]